MKPTIEVDTRLTGNMPGETVKLSMDLSQMSHFMKILTDLYEDGELAVIREYSTNASDSHAMAGVFKPIQVKLPSPLRQTFEVQDFGLGMSYEDIKGTYGTYGASTKRDTNDANGCLGLGSKSALTYTNMFSVRSVKDGELVHVAIYRDDEGTASMKFITKPVPTDEDNNTTVIVPTRSSNKFEEKALKFYSAWPKGTVEIEGYEIPFVSDSPRAFWLTKKILIVPTDSQLGDQDQNGKVYIVMGNVTYPYTEDDYNRRWSRNYATYYFAEMDGGRDGNAEVDFVPSRESLNLNAKTQAVVKNVVSQSDVTPIKAYAQKQISKAKTIHDAVKLVRPFTSLHSRIRDGDFEYKGTVLSSIVKVDKVKVFNPYTDDRLEMVFREDVIHVGTAHKSLFIIDKPDEKSFLFKNKEQVRVHMRNLGLDLKDAYCYFTPVPDNKLLEGVHTAKWEDIKKIDVSVVYQKHPKKEPKPTEYRVAWQGGRYHRPVPSEAKTIVYCSRDLSYRMAEWTRDDKELCFVYLTSQRIKKFLRENPTAITYDGWRDSIYSNLPKIEKHEADWLAMHDNHRKILGWALEIGIKDDYLEKLASVNAKKVEKARKAWYNYGKTTDGENYVSKKFPLADSRNEKHTKAYLKGLTLV